MANEIKTNHQSGDTLYAIVRNEIGDVYNNIDNAFVTFTSAAIAQYAITLNDLGGDLYSGDFPSAITTPGTYYALAYVKTGGTYTNSDPIISGGEIVWDGSAEASNDGNNLVSLSYVKGFIGITGSDQDAILLTRIAAASSAVRCYCGRSFLATAHTETHDLDWPMRVLTLRHYPISGLSTVTVLPYSDDAKQYLGSDFIITSYGAISPKPSSELSYFPAGFQSVKVVYQAEGGDVPPAVQQRVAIIAGNLYQQTLNADSSMLVMEQLGDEKYQYRLDAFTSMDSETKAILDQFRRWRV